MQRFCCALLLLSLVTAPAFSADKNKNKAKNKNPLPQALVAARYVCVTNAYGESESSRLDTKDRKAIADVQNALRQWGHYEVVDHHEDADLIVAVSTRFTPAPPHRETIPTNERPDYSAQWSSPRVTCCAGGGGASHWDGFLVFDAKLGVKSIFDADLGSIKVRPLWTYRMGHSPLFRKEFPLLKQVEQLEKEVETATMHP